MGTESYKEYLERLLTTFNNVHGMARGDGKSFNNTIDLYNTTCLGDFDKPKVLDVQEVVEDLVNIVKQCYEECYSDDVPKEFIQKLYTNIENYLNEA